MSDIWSLWLEFFIPSRTLATAGHYRLWQFPPLDQRWIRSPSSSVSGSNKSLLARWFKGVPDLMPFTSSCCPQAQHIPHLAKRQRIHENGHWLKQLKVAQRDFVQPASQLWSRCSFNSSQWRSTKAKNGPKQTKQEEYNRVSSVFNHLPKKNILRWRLNFGLFCLIKSPIKM